MFNSHIAKKRQVNFHKRLQQSKKELQWSSKYHQKIQPQLLAKYKQRIDRFVYQMGQNPIIVQDTSKRDVQQRRGKFIHKNAQDWKSIYTISQRLNLSKNKRYNLKKDSKTIDVVPQRSQQVTCFKAKTVQFRNRDKLKQINHPMKFSIHSKGAFSLPNRKRNHSLQAIKEKNQKQQESIENGSHSRQKTIRDSDNISDIFDLRPKGNDKDIGDEQKQKELKQKKIHYKKLMTLYLVGQDIQKKELKEILDKSGYIRKRRAATQSNQLDRFQSIVEKK